MHVTPLHPSAHVVPMCCSSLSQAHRFAVVKAAPVSATQACLVNHALASLERDRLPGTALDQLGVPRGVTITMQWRLSGELLCMGRLRNDCWSTDGDWIGNAASLLQALAEAAEARGADPGKLRFWMCYSPATEAAAASGSGSEAEPPDAQDAADLFPPYRGAPGSMAVGVLNGQHLVPMTPEQVPMQLEEKPDRS